jgi:hypothetical protein
LKLKYRNNGGLKDFLNCRLRGSTTAKSEVRKEALLH